MTNFIVINEETREFVNIDSIDNVESCDISQYNGIKPIWRIKSIIHIDNRKIDCPLTPKEIMAKINAIRK